MSGQQIVIQNNDYSDLKAYLESSNYKKVLLVCGHSIKQLQINSFFNELEKKGIMEFVRFNDFQPNPQYESVVKGVELYKKENCEAIIAVGGGSAMDVAKCIKLFSNMPADTNYLQQRIIPNDMELIAVPTTAGTGSEATHFAVIYHEGEKQSVSDNSCIPSIVVLDPSTLDSLSDYQRKVTMLDALCHGIESYWSLNSTDESKAYSKQAIQMVMNSMKSYLANESDGNSAMMQAANIAGKAINITKTTAGHAMCYKLTSLYGFAHGHAAALCVLKLWEYMVGNVAKCIDSRGKEYLKSIFISISQAMGCTKVSEVTDKFNRILNKMNLPIPKIENVDYNILRKSVNADRLKNHPVKLDEETIETIYRRIMNDICS